MLAATPILLLLTTTTAVTALNAPAQYKFAHNRLDCPAAHQTKFHGPHGGKWGVLCGWDTQSTTFFKGPYTSLDFEQCILKCGATKDCEIATFTGSCYLKKGARGLGYKRTGDEGHRVAVKLN